jgi:hypothetical protein
VERLELAAAQPSDVAELLEPGALGDELGGVRVRGALQTPLLERLAGRRLVEPEVRDLGLERRDETLLRELRVARRLELALQVLGVHRRGLRLLVEQRVLEPDLERLGGGLGGGEREVGVLGAELELVDISRMTVASTMAPGR